LDAAEKILRAELRVGDVLLALGAGNVNEVVERLSEN
jgi:UDP-N-acetylmuramate-alanine ligase